MFTAALPDGDNTRSVQVKNIEELPCAVRSRGKYFDIYGLVSYIVYGKKTDEEIRKNLPEAKRWICEQLGYYEYIDGFIPITPKKNWNDWLHKLIENKHENQIQNKVLDKSILNQYIIMPYEGWIKEGISYKTQIEFEVGFDVLSERVVFPVYNTNGELIGVKGRYVGKDEKIHKNMKYIYLYPCNKSLELFNLHRALPYIQEKREVIVFEGAKSVMMAHSMGFYNCVSIEGDSISQQQVQLLKNLGLDIKIVFAYDNDKTKKFIKEQIKKVTGRMTYVIYDEYGILGKKEEKLSPVDKGKNVFMKLYRQFKYRVGA